MAWAVQLLALFASRRHAALLPMAFLLAGFMLLVSRLAQMDPAITPTLPILDTPWLAIHVSVVMVSYALFSFTFACSVAALFTRRGDEAALSRLRRLSLLMLHPALLTLTLGIFTGSAWADGSWGHYWSWDPKETWALVPLAAYAPAVHAASLPWMRRPAFFHAYVAAAFAVLLVTYFGVNYFFGGLHSYA